MTTDLNSGSPRSSEKHTSARYMAEAFAVVFAASFGLFIVYLMVFGDTNIIRQTLASTSYNLEKDGLAAVRRNLKDPSSATFEDTYVEQDEGCFYGKVNARNGLGGYAGLDRFVVDGEKVAFENDGTGGYSTVSDNCSVRGATKKLQTETNPESRRLLQAVIDTNKELAAVHKGNTNTQPTLPTYR